MEIKNKKTFNLDDIPPQILGHSQKGQDSKIEALINLIQPPNKFFVEFGAYDGVTNLNCWHLRENLGWKGLLLEGGQSNPAINLHDEFLTAENICSIFEKYNVPKDLGFVSADVDGNDFFLLKSIFENYRPSIIMVECCARFKPTESIVQKYNPTWCWNGKTWYGSSALAFQKMAAKFNYKVAGMYLDDLFLVDSNLTNVEFEVELRQNIELYDSHGDCSFDPENFKTYE